MTAISTTQKQREDAFEDAVQQAVIVFSMRGFQLTAIEVPYEIEKQIRCKVFQTAKGQVTVTTMLKGPTEPQPKKVVNNNSQFETYTLSMLKTLEVKIDSLAESHHRDMLAMLEATKNSMTILNEKISKLTPTNYVPVSTGCSAR